MASWLLIISEYLTWLIPLDIFLAPILQMGKLRLTQKGGITCSVFSVASQSSDPLSCRSDSQMAWTNPDRKLISPLGVFAGC